MTTQILPVPVITKGNGEFIVLHIFNYVIGGSSATVGWDLYLAIRESTVTESISDDSGNIITPASTTDTIRSGNCILSGELLIDGDDFINWGSDDEFIINWVINKLKFIRI